MNFVRGSYGDLVICNFGRGKKLRNEDFLTIETFFEKISVGNGPI